MAIRESLHRRRGVATGVGIACVALAAFLIFRNGAGRPKGYTGFGKAWFTNDDGQTWFAESAATIPPFDHNGKPAYRAQVYRCAHGSAFVAYLMSYAPSDKKSIEQAIAGGKTREEILDLEMSLRPQLKKPGPGDWVRMTPKTADAYFNMMKPSCPDGSLEGLEIVDPNE